MLADALRVQGMVLMRREQCEEARQALEEGLDLAQTTPLSVR